ncbi:FecR domain-containing protein [Achromobacter aloeverae]|uniref:Iron dicitrate transport regulator FecR n=1 Tax=Achromobacter aloeverae TaxID=1750518 RepID=A0A4Q1HK70_9BURK|nr:FecR domain-containing protein [Achromobacter aloeverae]RXN90411.1 iron dicitrate transport regulator FecR [Achromobacter aloeverae]
MARPGDDAPPPLNDDHPIDPAIVRQAAAWSVRVWSGDATPADLQACSAWRAQRPEHELAWQRISGLAARFQAVPSALSRPVLKRHGAHSSRRRGLLLGAGAFAVASLGVWQSRPRSAWRLARADHRTGVGEIRSVTLADGVRILLDTDTAINVAYTDRQRVIELVQGRVLVQTHPDPASPARPFRVATRDGAAVAHGTRYTVALADTGTDVQVLEGVVELRPADSGERQWIRAGQQAHYDAYRAGPPGPNPPAAPAWAEGLIAVEGMPLGRFLDELARYRPGVLRYDGAIAQLPVSGVYSLRDTDLTLHALAEALPLRIQRYTRYWTIVRLADGPAQGKRGPVEGMRR